MIGPAHVGTLTQDGAEVKMAATHVFVFFQSCCNLELKVLQILKHAHIHTDIKQAYCGKNHTYSQT